MITDFRSMHAEMVSNEKLSEDQVLNTIQNSLTEISPALILKSLNLPRTSERSYHIQTDDPDPPVVPIVLKALC